METLLGLQPTGRELRDPAARLIEAADDDGRTYTVIDFDAAHDGHEALTLNVEMVISFMEYPMVTGLVELAKHDVPGGQFAYPTGSVWLLADVLRAFGDFGHIVGLRAAMELAWLVGQILVEAGDTGPVQGCFSHGNLNPWRIALRADGEVQVLGYGLPQVELIRHRHNDGPAIDASSLRYCPPERLEGSPEDAAADTYGLTLVCFEVATGKPLFTSHDVDELERIVGMSEGATMLSRDNHGLPPKVAKVLAKALVYDPDTRLSGQDYVDAIGRLLATEPMDGPSLTEVVQTLQGHQKSGAPKGRKLVSTANTSMFTPDQLAELVDDDDDAEAPASESRWKKVDRRKGDADDEEDAPKQRTRRRSDALPAKPSRRKRRGEPAEAKPPAKGRRRRRKADDAPEAQVAEAAEASGEAPAPSEHAEPPAKKAPAKKASRRRRKAPAETKDEAASEPEDKQEEAPAPAEVDPKPAKKRRRRKAPASDDQGPAEPKKAAPKKRTRKAPPAEEPEPEPAAEEEPKRRRRRPIEDDEDDVAPRRRRRRATTDDEEDDDPPPRRRRKKA